MINIHIAPERILPFQMAKDHKKMFIDALNSGDYEQIQGNYIEYEQGSNGKPCVCAVGVYLAQLNELSDLTCASEEEGMNGIEFGWLGPKYEKDKHHSLISCIIDMNDGLQMSFKSIAEWIEDNVEGI